jgi:hypothetical protein
LAAAGTAIPAMEHYGVNTDEHTAKLFMKHIDPHVFKSVSETTVPNLGEAVFKQIGDNIRRIKAGDEENRYRYADETRPRDGGDDAEEKTKRRDTIFQLLCHSIPEGMLCSLFFCLSRLCKIICFLTTCLFVLLIPRY